MPGFFNRSANALPFWQADDDGNALGTQTNPSRSATQGSGSIATGQIAVTTSATLVVAARPGRSKVTLSPTSAVVYYVGNSNTVSATNGLYVAAGGVVTLDTASAIYAVGAANVTISYVEFY